MRTYCYRCGEFLYIAINEFADQWILCPVCLREMKRMAKKGKRDEGSKVR